MERKSYLCAAELTRSTGVTVWMYYDVPFIRWKERTNGQTVRCFSKCFSNPKTKQIKLLKETEHYKWDTNKQNNKTNQISLGMYIWEQKYLWEKDETNKQNKNNMFVCSCIYLNICLFVYLFVYIYLLIHILICLFIYLFVHLSAHLSVFLSFHLLIYIFVVYLSVYLFDYLFIYL